MEDFNTKKGTLVPKLPKRASSDYLNKLQIQPNSGANRNYIITLFFFYAPTKAKTGPAPTSITGQSRILRYRRKGFYKAIRFAEVIGLPMRLTFTLTWSCLTELGGRNEGNILGRTDEERCAELRERMARWAKELGFGFALVWGRAVAPDVGAHMHGLVCWPPEHIDVLIDLFASVTGSDVSDDPFDPSNPNEQAGDIRSYCRGWLLRWGKFGLGGALRFSDYIAEQDEKFPELQTLAGRCFGSSNAIGHSERRKAGW
jgi:hypothetical protein